MEIGTTVYTPRFCSVRIKEIFNSTGEALKAGYTEPTYYYKDGWTVRGKVYKPNHMYFAAVKE